MILLSAVFFSGLFMIGLLLAITAKLQDRAKWRETVKVNSAVTILVIIEFIIGLILLCFYGSMVW